MHEYSSTLSSRLNRSPIAVTLPSLSAYESLDATRIGEPDGGALLYSERHRAKRWQATDVPKLEQLIIDGDIRFSVSSFAFMVE